MKMPTAQARSGGASHTVQPPPLAPSGLPGPSKLGGDGVGHLHSPDPPAHGAKLPCLPRALEMEVPAGPQTQVSASPPSEGAPAGAGLHALASTSL